MINVTHQEVAFKKIVVKIKKKVSKEDYFFQVCFTPLPLLLPGLV